MWRDFFNYATGIATGASILAVTEGHASMLLVIGIGIVTFFGWFCFKR